MKIYRLIIKVICAILFIMYSIDECKARNKGDLIKEMRAKHNVLVYLILILAW